MDGDPGNSDIITTAREHLRNDNMAANITFPRAHETSKACNVHVEQRNPA
ncbi:predicted protein [Plenodomus lingam JN3]|uniref:Predicted protein n=1 Tax=Leptosphaeria maculans (strain JN3 / isolate v23.1.3 / race Av1-4-5-6-7-8) TaxID=985895 RepID=E4ZI60_LEPMJ|nr:predicted protein [Plenodomus lingam JN3]CBX91203.1 predicted protein [Plenodomus lingam JN3]